MSGRPEDEASQVTQPLVLIVDDFEDNRAMYAEYLTFSGFRVAEAADGAAAVAKAAELLPDVVVMDLSLPVMDGWEATRRIKSTALTAHVMVIALTGHALAAHSQGAKDAGCDEFLGKPCLPETLVERVKALIARRDAARTA